MEKQSGRGRRVLGWLVTAVVGLWAFGQFGLGNGFGTVAWGHAGGMCPTGATALYLDADTGDLLECEGGEPLGGFDEGTALAISAEAQRLAGDADGLTEADRDEVARFAEELQAQ